MAEAALRVRRSVRELQTEYENGNKGPLEDLMRAWKGIKDLPPDNPNSFFILGGYHGEPFDYRDNAEDKLYWGGYCNHGNVLFPTWHRAYMLRLENALRTIVPGVTMAYWDETSDESREHGIPWVLTALEFELDGETIPNPLRSFVLPLPLSDDESTKSQGGMPIHIYAKPAGYETVRYPLTGLVGTPEAKAKTEAQNAPYMPIEEHWQEANALLNDNVTAWLKGNDPTPEHPNPVGNGIYEMFRNCLRAPNYTAFSNTTSAAQWSKENPGVTTALEEPHNDIHIAVGGFAVGESNGKPVEMGQIADVNGDMGENNTAALDPIFFFHHCNVDRMFWLWQQYNDHCDEFEIIEGYAGANSDAMQGPTPGVPWGTPLNMDSALVPFMKSPDEYYTSRDCANIETQMGYSYSRGSFDETDNVDLARPESDYGSPLKLVVTALDRALFEGSFVIRAHATADDGTEYYLGHHTVLSRRNIVNCVNCQQHLEVVASFPLHAMPADAVDRSEFSISIQHRNEELPAGLDFELHVSE